LSKADEEEAWDSVVFGVAEATVAVVDVGVLMELVLGVVGVLLPQLYRVLAD
jgi:hypothetical protein